MNAIVRWSDEWKAVNKARETIPVNLYSLAAELGITIRPAFLGADVSGTLEKSGDKFVLSFNAAHPVTRQRFTIAHELGHFMLHRSLVGDGISDDKAYRSTTSGRYQNTSIGPMQETEANRFAANLLMPAGKVDDDWNRTRDSKAMAKMYGVSEQSMRIRLGL